MGGVTRSPKQRAPVAPQNGDIVKREKEGIKQNKIKQKHHTQ